MGTIRVEAVPVQKFGLGLLFFDHLQLVFQDETDAIDSQDYWYVVEGVIDGGAFSGTLGAIGEDGRTSLAVANDASRDALVAKLGTPEQRGSRILTISPDALATWDLIADYAGGIEDLRLPYYAFSLPFAEAPTINSTSLAASALWSVGIDLSLLMPFGVGFSPGGSTLIGTAEADNLETTENFSTLVGGGGNDVFTGRSTSVIPEKFYGGEGDDVFYWSEGDNIINGGQPRLSPTDDGFDTVDYSGAGEVTIKIAKHAVDGKLATFTAAFDGGFDRLTSIEQVLWNPETDIVIAGDGVGLLENPVILDLKGQSGSDGDKLSLSGGRDALIINAVNANAVSVQLAANEGLDAGYWAQSVEWLVASDGDDRIYSGEGVYQIEGGAGADMIDARLAGAFTGQSPRGYDVELSGGDGDDIIVSGSGRTYATGGAGSDIFVLSTMSAGDDSDGDGEDGEEEDEEEDRIVTFVIADADASDKLYAPFDFFRLERGDYEGSRLIQLAGAPFDLTSSPETSYFDGLPPEEVPPEQNFIGSIGYRIEGPDLIIRLLQGSYIEIIIGGEPVEGLRYEIDTATEIRVLDWSDGDLGITFPLLFDIAVFDETGIYYDYPGLREALAEHMAPDRFLDPLAARPDAHIPLEIAAALGDQSASALRTSALSVVVTQGGDGDDVLEADGGGPYQFYGRGGNDEIVGSAGGDTLDGGAGADVMTGGRGNDFYVVDDAGDMVTEEAGGGFDRVLSSIDYELGGFVEHLALTGDARTGAGNALRNTIEGNDGDNVLDGGDGDDTLAGNLGDDILIGGAGGDGYVFEPGDGRDVIIEAPGEAGDDAIIFAGGVLASDVALYRDAATENDLIVSLANGGGRITVRDFFAGAGIETIAFSDGEVWSGAGLAERAEAAPLLVNLAPVARDDAFGAVRQPTIAIPLAALIDNDIDDDGDALTLSSVVAVAGGAASIAADGSVVLSPDAGANEFIVEYEVSDGRGGTSQARLTLALYDNARPVIDQIEFAPVIEDQQSAGRIVAFDPEAGPLQFSVKAGAAAEKGSVIVADDGAFVYTPHADANGPDAFTLVITDAQGASIERAFTFEIDAVNDAPVASGDSGFQMQAGSQLVIDGATLLANDFDVDGDALSIVSVGNGQDLVVALNASGEIEVTSAAGVNGQRSFAYSVSDGQGGVTSASVTVDVQSLNAAPTIQSAHLPQVHEDKSAKGRLVASDADGDALLYAMAPDGGPSKGTVTLKPDGSFTYKPDRNKNGPESFTLTVTDGKSAPTEYTFNFTIKPDFDLFDILDLLAGRATPQQTFTAAIGRVIDEVNHLWHGANGASGSGWHHFD